MAEVDEVPERAYPQKSHMGFEKGDETVGREQPSSLEEACYHATIFLRAFVCTSVATRLGRMHAREIANLTCPRASN